MKRLLPSIACLLCSAALLSAALPPGAIESLKKEAGEVLRVEITAVEVAKSEGRQKNVTYQAIVVGTERSKAKLKPGDRIRIESYIFVQPEVKPLTKPNPTEEELLEHFAKISPIVGPKPPSLLAKGWKGMLYLNAGKKKGHFRIAAYGHSFE